MVCLCMLKETCRDKAFINCKDSLYGVWSMRRIVTLLLQDYVAFRFFELSFNFKYKMFYILILWCQVRYTWHCLDRWRVLGWPRRFVMLSSSQHSAAVLLHPNRGVNWRSRPAWSLFTQIILMKSLVSPGCSHRLDASWLCDCFRKGEKKEEKVFLQYVPGFCSAEVICCGAE